MLNKYFSIDELLDNVMVYWLSGNITSTMRFYKENIGNLSLLTSLSQSPVLVPAGFAWFPNEFVFASRSQVGYKFTNLVHFTYMEEGGHFGAFQCPRQLAAELRSFVGKIQPKEM